MNETMPAEPRKRRSSAVTSGRRLFVTGDGNSAWARRYRDLCGQHIADLGGKDMLSEAQLSLVRRAATLEVELELLEGKMSLGESVDLDVFGRSASHLRRILESIGIERRAKPVKTWDQAIAEIVAARSAPQENQP
jgi:hypothetical protein